MKEGKETATMDAACMPPEQEEMRATKNRHIPPEIVVEILLNLPAKSLRRFSRVSKSWNSMIFESGFIERYHGDATLPGREKMVINLSKTLSSCPPSSISEQPIKDATKLICPFQKNSRSAVYLHAICDELSFAQVKNSLFLWNPSMGTYRKLPDPSLPPFPRNSFFQFVYGLGYDSIGDDYKILKIPKVNFYENDAELYSLRSDSWRKIQPFPGNTILGRKGVFVSGALHWMVHPFPFYLAGPHIIISFDLSTEKYGEVAQPWYYPIRRSDEGEVEVTVLRGMLCLCLNYYRDTRFVLWVMKDYGVAKSWSQMFDIQYYNSIPFFPKNLGGRSLITLTPLYFYDYGEILIKVSTDSNYSEIFIYKDEDTIPQKIVGSGCSTKKFHGFLYVESLISPATWPDDRHLNTLQRGSNSRPTTAASVLG